MWMVFIIQIKIQIFEVFKNLCYFYCQELDEVFGGKVVVFDVEDFIYICFVDLGIKVCVVILIMVVLCVENQEGCKVYEYYEDLEFYFVGSVFDLFYLEQNQVGKVIVFFVNLFKFYGLLVIIDEVYNVNIFLFY